MFYTITGRAIAEVIRRWLLTAETWVQSRVSSNEICAGRSSTGAGFFPSS